jgi:hypothetical protein
MHATPVSDLARIVKPIYRSSNYLSARPRDRPDKFIGERGLANAVDAVNTDPRWVT